MFSGVSNISVSPVSEHGGHTVYLETLQDLTGQYNTTQNKLAIELNQNILDRQLNMAGFLLMPFNDAVFASITVSIKC